MSSALAFVLLGVLLLIALIVLLARSQSAERDGIESIQDRNSTATHGVELIPRELAERLFGSQDWDFVDRPQSAPLKRLFLQQRTALALCWLRSVRISAKKLMEVHLAASRASSSLVASVELKIAVAYVTFQIFCRFVALVIWLRGPVAMNRLIGQVDYLAERLSQVITKCLPGNLGAESKMR